MESSLILIVKFFKPKSKTNTEIDSVFEPPPPEQVNEKVFVPANESVKASEPEISLVPSQAPPALHEVAFVDDQLIFILDPLTTS